MACSSSAPITMRSGFMKSSTAAPSFRNSGLEATANGDVLRRGARVPRRSPRERGRPYPPEPSTCRRSLWARSSGGRCCAPPRSRTCMSALPSSSGGVPTAMNCSAPCATARSTSVVNCSRPAAALRRTIGSRPGSWIGTPPLFEDIDLARVDVEAQHVVADLGEAGAGDQADIARADHRDLHVATPMDALIAASAATGLVACVTGRPTTR